MLRRGYFLPALAIAAIALASGAAVATAQAPAPEPQTSLPEIEGEVMCPVCGTTLELATESAQAIRQRELIRGLIADGLTKDEIKDELVAEFGPGVLATPDTEGFDLAAWVVPGAAAVAALGAIFVGLRRWRSAGAEAAAGHSPTPTGPDDADAKRLEADLKRYDL